MNAESVKRFPWGSFCLLLVAYASLGWLLAAPALTSPVWFFSACQQTLETLKALLPDMLQTQSVCKTLAKENLSGAVLALGWIVFAAIAFMSPLTSFNRFIVRWFKSDTVAFLSICLIAGMITLVLFWLQLFLHISAIMASEALARIDLQTLGYGKLQSVWILMVISFAGLAVGWAARLVV